jgi:sugar lactone lactonase YvrE
MSGGAAQFDNIYDIFVDGMDNVWVGAYGSGVYRFEDIVSPTGTVTRVPALYLETGQPSAISDSGQTLLAPVSLLVDSAGRLYVGNENFEVTRFDGARTLTGTPVMEASAYLNTGIDYPYMVALDAAGALWVAHYNGDLVKLPDPSGYSGNVDVSGDITVQLSWLAAGSIAFPDGGTIKFVPR